MVEIAVARALLCVHSGRSDGHQAAFSLLPFRILPAPSSTGSSSFGSMPDFLRNVLLDVYCRALL